MKTHFRIISALIALVMIVSCCTSCRSMIMGMLENKSDKEKAELLTKRSDSYYSNGIHEDTTVNVEISGTISDVKVSETSTSNTKSTFKNYGKSSFTCLTTSTIYSESKSGDSTEISEYTRIDGFVDKKNLIFAYIPQGRSADKEEPVYFKSQCTPKDAYTFYAQKASNSAGVSQSYGDLFGSVKVTTDEDDENWIITYSDFNKNKSSYFYPMLGNLATSFSAAPVIEEATAVFKIDVLRSAIVHYDINMSVSIFDLATLDTDLLVDISISSDLSKPSSGKLTPENMEDYIEAGDLRYNYYAMNALQALTDSDDRSFDFCSTTSLKATAKKGNATQSLINHGLSGTFNYGKIDNKYLCNVSLKGSGGSGFSLTYDGKRLYANNQYISGGKTEAKYYIKSLLSSFSFNEEDITAQTVTIHEDGSSTTKISFRVTPQLKNTFASLGLGKAKIEDHSIELVVNLDNELNLKTADISIKASKEKYVSYQMVNYTFAYSAKISGIDSADKDELSALITP